ncbi:2Fe-2S iron-sulfur cluster-binding protein [Mycobacterium sp.]|uniref:2Fe-2S iron-sulfur cluster-binding protein n=1 Tax=Mycobacterium sp. TaxID=1785 RepID=UPI002D151A29|nr:2Fe-2S iron-sulfur cluster-binding protein [Mycobacterium sp.]HKP43018.1 2Fe-2S iron-sulfur cluster-binding protein [Mycobacterium sp.]
MVAVRVEPLGAVLDVLDGETLIEAAWRQGYYWPTICQGKARCTQCSVEVIEGLDNLGQPDRDELVTLQLRLALQLNRLRDRLRLACCVRPTGDAVVNKAGVRYTGDHPQNN